MGRTVTLILVGDDGGVLGAMPPFEVSTPWWQGVDEFPPEVTVLRGPSPAVPACHEAT